MGGPWQRSALFAKKVVFFFRAGSGGLIQPIATFANRKSTSNHHPTVAGWPAGWKRWLADCAITGDIQWVAIELMRTFVPEPSDLIEIVCPSDVICSHGVLTEVGGGKPQPHYKVSFKMCHQTWEILMKTFFLLVRSSTNVFFFLVPYLMTGSLKSERWGRTQQIGSPAQVERIEDISATPPL